MGHTGAGTHQGPLAPPEAQRAVPTPCLRTRPPDREGECPLSPGLRYGARDTHRPHGRGALRCGRSCREGMAPTPTSPRLGSPLGTPHTHTHTQNLGHSLPRSLLPTCLLVPYSFPKYIIHVPVEQPGTCKRIANFSSHHWGLPETSALRQVPAALLGGCRSVGRADGGAAFTLRPCAHPPP